MTAFDDNPEYEAQLKDVLFPQMSGRDEDYSEGQEGVQTIEDQSEYGILNDAPTFRMKVPPDAAAQKIILYDEDDISLTGGKTMSEDARSISTGDDSPSAQVQLPNASVDKESSEIILSAHATPTKLNGYGYLSPARAFSPSRGFDIRQHSRLTSYSSIPPRSSTPSSIHSRMSSVSVDVGEVTDISANDSPNVPWEVVRWTKLRKIEGQAFSEIGKRKFGTPTVLAVLCYYTNGF